ncbi:MAG: hypothetical protein MJY67_03525 [Bacteroidales bacterium]|nr:hypothetical protein [Bacteroidales bacterium]
MKEALTSKYIVDGIDMDATPAELLSDCMDKVPQGPSRSEKTIEDESFDPNPTPSTFVKSKIGEYIKGIGELGDKFQERHPEFAARHRAAVALLDLLWREGHFNLSDISISAKWHWKDRSGDFASLYRSVEGLCQYVYDLGVKIEGYDIDRAENVCRLELSASVRQGAPDEFDDDSSEIILSEGRKCPDKAVLGQPSALIYLPFDTCGFRLGASALSAMAGNGSDNAPELQDPDYFIDCYEVVRELVEDGIILSGVTVGKGGLACAAAKLCSECALSLDTSGVASSYAESNLGRILFAEVPGVLFQVSESDLDYIDSQFLLQDVAYYPVGSPKEGEASLTVRSDMKKPAVEGILRSLIASASEGED